MSAPTSPPAARRYTSPPLTSPTSPTTVRAGSVKPAPAPATPEKLKAATPAPASPPKPSPKKSDDGKDKGKDKDKPAASAADEYIPEISPGPDINRAVFSQITEMDDEDDFFSNQIVRDYFKQAATTFEELDNALKARDFEELSSKGHFLKGSSATLGLEKVQKWCEHIQHYGNKRDEVKGVDLTEEQALRRIELIMPRLKRDYESAQAWLKNYYREQGADLDEEDDD
ncbi:Multistep phosphorelay regulator 1 [Schizosaccharomyces pombe 972h-] [Rhizoctonia solani]|uniref:Multistep phosphorelay regulator 1 [Schizosaccharomyces pombe 972h-] n=1 Tax=Rhizoctonia solani TaxID=456999 RepID=A0A0K6G2S6_9AGAM|nr:Multistep phosphorelay regulator 1 [Schizosaccharomyces pombe 972h-] [Rhizoctonia solani]